MRLLTLCCEYPPVGGGGATACQGLAEALVRSGHEVDVVTSGMPDLARSTSARRSGRATSAAAGRGHSAATIVIAGAATPP